MNCCDSYGTCTRSFGCPAQGPDHTPAAVAPIKQTSTRCQELGVCQSLTPCCSGCSIGNQAEQQDVFDRVSYYIAVGLAAGATVGWVVGLASYALHRYEWLTL